MENEDNLTQTEPYNPFFIPDENMRFNCLEQAVKLGGPAKEVLTYAEQFYSFVKGMASIPATKD